MESIEKSEIRKIIHIDMDAFYAAIEQRDNPDLIGKPVIVGGKPDSRGVVATCSYEARKFGIHSAMPSSKAYRLCPQAIFLPPRFSAYKEESQKIRRIFFEYTDLVEPLSLDEAFLDVTNNTKQMPSATRIAQQIKEKIFNTTHLTASAGVSYNKFIAKVASDIKKPDGLTVIPPGQGQAFIERLPIRRFFGVGQATEKKMLALGIHNGADLKKYDQNWLIRHFGKVGTFYYNITRGIDHRPVNPNRIRKSIGKEKTLVRDITDIDEIEQILVKIAENVSELLVKQQLKGCTLTLKIKFFDFEQITRSHTVQEPIQDSKDMMNIVRALITQTAAGVKKIRLLGISISNLTSKNEENVIQNLFLYP